MSAEIKNDMLWIDNIDYNPCRLELDFFAEAAFPSVVQTYEKLGNSSTRVIVPLKTKEGVVMFSGILKMENGNIINER